VAAGQLVPALLDAGDPEPLAIWAVYPTMCLAPPKVRLFIAVLEAHLQRA